MCTKTITSWNMKSTSKVKAKSKSTSVMTLDVENFDTQERGIEHATLMPLQPIDVAIMAHHILRFHISVETIVSDFTKMKLNFHLHGDVAFYLQLCTLVAQKNRTMKEKWMSGINRHEDEKKITCSSCGKKAYFALSDSEGNRQYLCRHCHTITTHLVDFPEHLQTPLKVFSDVTRKNTPFPLWKLTGSSEDDASI